VLTVDRYKVIYDELNLVDFAFDVSAPSVFINRFVLFSECDWFYSLLLLLFMKVNSPRDQPP
jgi:hypothetical protein